MNNRDIKFRAWDEEAGIMIYSDDNTEEYWWELFPLQVGIIIGEKVYDPLEYPEPIVKYIEQIMQFSMLFDNEEKEIYEGDCLKTDMGNILTVEFKAGCFMVRWNDQWYEPLSKVLNFVKIVGNIYENPELLKP